MKKELFFEKLTASEMRKVFKAAEEISGTKDMYIGSTYWDGTVTTICDYRYCDVKVVVNENETGFVVPCDITICVCLSDHRKSTVSKVLDCRVRLYEVVIDGKDTYHFERYEEARKFSNDNSIMHNAYVLPLFVYPIVFEELLSDTMKKLLDKGNHVLIRDDDVTIEEAVLFKLMNIPDEYKKIRVMRDDEIGLYLSAYIEKMGELDKELAIRTAKLMRDSEYRIKLHSMTPDELDAYVQEINDRMDADYEALMANDGEAIFNSPTKKSIWKVVNFEEATALEFDTYEEAFEYWEKTPFVDYPREEVT